MDPQQPSENGSVKIDDQVLKQIIYDAVSEIEGVRVVSNRFFERFLQFVSRRPASDSVWLEMKTEKDVNAKVSIGIRGGTNLSETVKGIQETVKEKVRKTANISLNRLDIHIVNMDREVT